MILKESYAEDWIRSMQKEYRSDPILTEKVILALTLLEQLKISGLNFIFKGGTSLVLLFGELKRLSIDIDIIVDPNSRKSLESILESITSLGVFSSLEKNERVARAEIPKAHYKFYYQSAITQKQEYILLDILFEKCPYNQIIDVEIRSKFLKYDDVITKVHVPSVNCILGDKLTAFAPNTTGIPYKVSKEMEIIKQLYDVANLFDIMDNVAEVKDSFNRIAKQEIAYRGMEIEPDDVLWDIFDTASIITYRGQKSPECFDDLFMGIRKIGPYILTQAFTLDVAIQCASKAVYLAMILLRDMTTIEKYTGIESVTTLSISHSEFNKFNKIKKTDPQAFYYWCKAIELYGGSGMSMGQVTFKPGIGAPL